MTAKCLLNHPIILIVSTLAAFTVMQPPIGWSALAWVALVPWAVAVLRSDRPVHLFWLNYAAGLVYFLANLYWLVHVTPAGYVALCFYLGWYFPLTAVALRYGCRRRRWPVALVLPILWVGQEYLRARMLTGFPWLFLSHSLHDHTALIQIADVTGAYGLTFLLAMVSGIVTDAILFSGLPAAERPRGRRRQILIGTVAMGLIAATLAYGFHRLQETSRVSRPGEVITVVQENLPQEVRGSEVTPDEIFGRHYAASEAALAEVVIPDLIVWPETMCRPLNDELLNLPLRDFGFLKSARSQDVRLRQLAQRGVAVLVGAPSILMEEFEYEWRSTKRWNSAILYLPDGERFPHRYDKMHLVPFGEVVPFKYSWPWLYRVLNSLTPYDYEYSLEAGREPVIFQYDNRAGDTRRFAVAICYEDVVPYLPRQLALAPDGSKRIDFLLNISNDGWFVRKQSDGSVVATSELLQHLAICQFRAVENRIAIARAVNTGVSGFIASDGRVHDGKLGGTLCDDPLRRTAVAGTLTDRIALDPRITLYTRIGDVFAGVMTILTAVIFIVAVRAHRRERAMQTPSENSSAPRTA